MRKPFAITLDVGTSLANHTGSWRNERPVYLDRMPPCNHQCPAGENIQAWLFHAESGDYEQAWRKLVEDNPFPAIMGGSATTAVKARATAASWTRRSASIPLKVFWAIRPSPGAGNSRLLPSAQGKRYWWSAPDRPGFLPPITSHAWDTRSPSMKPAPCRAA
jgi:hypothetical protein